MPLQALHATASDLPQGGQFLLTFVEQSLVKSLMQYKDLLWYEALQQQ